MVKIVFLLLALASQAPDPPLTDEPGTSEGLACYWSCMALCVVTGNRLDQCDAACTDLCFTVATPGPTCEPDDGPVACAE